MDVQQIPDFPILDLEYLKDLTVGIYQINLTPSYVQDKLQREGQEEFQVEMMRAVQRLPQPGLIRVRIFLRFRNATKYQLWIAYRPNNEEEAANDADEGDELGDYCTCKSGARTLVTYAHIANVLWYVGYAQHQQNIIQPSALVAARTTGRMEERDQSRAAVDSGTAEPENKRPGTSEPAADGTSRRREDVQMTATTTTADDARQPDHHCQERSDGASTGSTRA